MGDAAPVLRDLSQDADLLALNTATLGHNLDGFGAGWSCEQIIDACAERGLGGITFWRREIAPIGTPRAAFEARAIEVGQKVRGAGMQVVGLCRTPFVVGRMAPRPLSVLFDDFKASIDMAAALGAPTLTIVVGGIEPGHSLKQSLALVQDRVGQMADYAAAQNVGLGLEPLNPVYGGNRSCLTTVRDAVDMIQVLDHPAVGLAVDVYHVWWDLSLAEQLQRLKPNQIHGFHLCDWLEDTEDFLLDRGMMGDGVADLKGLRAAVEGAGYRGLCEVEIFAKNTWWTKAPGEVLDTCVARFKEVC